MQTFAQTCARNLTSETQTSVEASRRAVLLPQGRGSGGFFVPGHFAPDGAYSVKGGDH